MQQEQGKQHRTGSSIPEFWLGVSRECRRERQRKPQNQEKSSPKSPNPSWDGAGNAARAGKGSEKLKNGRNNPQDPEILPGMEQGKAGRSFSKRKIKWGGGKRKENSRKNKAASVGCSSASRQETPRKNRDEDCKRRMRIPRDGWEFQRER